MEDFRYYCVKTRFWRDEKVRRWPEDTKLLALYLITCPINNILGCYVLPRDYIYGNLGWDPGQLQEHLGRLAADGFLKYDDSCHLMFLVNYLKHNPIANENQAAAAARVLQELPKSRLLVDLKVAVTRQGRPYLKPLAQALERACAWE